MTSSDAQVLFGAAVLKVHCMRSSAGQTADVADGADAPLASVDGGGTVSGRSGNPVLYARLVFEGRVDRGTDAKLEVSDAAGQPLGEVRVTKYSFGPRATKAADIDGGVRPLVLAAPIRYQALAAAAADASQRRD